MSYKPVYLNQVILPSDNSTDGSESFESSETTRSNIFMILVNTKESIQLRSNPITTKTVLFSLADDLDDCISDFEAEIEIQTGLVSNAFSARLPEVEFNLERSNVWISTQARK